MQRKTISKRRGVSLLEMALTMAMLATLVTAVAAVLRSSQQTWQGQTSDRTRQQAAHAVIRHLTRHVRQADSVLAITTARDRSSSLTLQMPNKQSWVWSQKGGQVYFGVDAADTLLAEDIDALELQGFKADAVTATKDPAEVQLVRIRATVTLDRNSGAEHTVQGWAWKRAW